MGAQVQAIRPEDDLESLFDQVADQRSRELEQIAAAVPRAAGPALAEVPADPVVDVHQRLGHLTRALHDALSGLGYDKTVSKVVQGLPDARDRLNYIAQLTGDAAEKALNCVDRGKALQQDIGAESKALSLDWERVWAKQASVEEFRAIAARTRAFFAAAPKRTDELGAVLSDIMMAQDFHDLTGQVIKKIVDLAKYTEEQLIALLVETTAPERRAEMEHGLAGPVVNASGRNDVVADQKQVDDLLEQLGF